MHRNGRNQKRTTPDKYRHNYPVDHLEEHEADNHVSFWIPLLFFVRDKSVTLEVLSLLRLRLLARRRFSIHVSHRPLQQEPEYVSLRVRFLSISSSRLSHDRRLT